MKIKFVFLFFLCHIFLASKAQETRLKYMGIDAGINFFAGEMSDMENIRREIPKYYTDYVPNTITFLSSKKFASIKYEIFSLNDRLGLAGGLRFLQQKSSAGKDGYLRSSTSYFYWKLNETGVNTEYLRINEISQTSDYIGIPLEARFYIAKKPHLIRLYAKIGAEIDYLLQTKTDIDFYDPAMKTYNDEVASKIDKPKKLNTSIYGGFGVALGGDSKPSLSIEGCMPYFILSSHATGLIDSFFGGGFQINLQIPIK